MCKKELNVYGLIFLSFTFMVTETGVLKSLEELCITGEGTVIFLCESAQSSGWRSMIV